MRYMPMHREIRHLLPAYCAGSLDDEAMGAVEAALLGAPDLLAEAMELMAVNETLLRVRADVDAGAEGA